MDMFLKKKSTGLSDIEMDRNTSQTLSAPTLNSPMKRGWEIRRHSTFVSPTAVSGSSNEVYSDADKPTVITRESIWDILHFAHYAEIAYINFEKIEVSELLISTFKNNSLFHAPFLISYDHDWKAVVVSIRGTYSAIDVLVDLKIDLEPLDASQPEGMVHSGSSEFH